MMTLKEFEERKQFIIGFIESGIAERELIMRGHERALIMDIKALQPPKPPKCATCDYCSIITQHGHDEMRCENNDVTNNPAHPDFGCNKHSDYKDTLK